MKHDEKVLVSVCSAEAIRSSAEVGVEGSVVNLNTDRRRVRGKLGDSQLRQETLVTILDAKNS